MAFALRHRSWTLWGSSNRTSGTHTGSGIAWPDSLGEEDGLVAVPPLNLKLNQWAGDCTRLAIGFHGNLVGSTAPLAWGPNQTVRLARSPAGRQDATVHQSGAKSNPAHHASIAKPAMRALHSPSPFELFDRLEQQLNQQRPSRDTIPAAEVHESAEAFVVIVDLPGVAKDAIEVKATDRNLVISAERQSPHQPGPEADAKAPLLSEIRYGTWGRSFRFQQPINREQLQASYRDGLLTVTVPKANIVTSVTVKVEG
jgi:HSP20 family protein